jgi:UDP-N-acetylglucosamine acyltransferase
LERSGLGADTVSTLTKAYKILFRSGLTLDNALSRLEADLPSTPELKELNQFVRASQRGLAR